MITSVRQQLSQITSELEQSNGMVPFGGLVTRDDCTR